MADTKVSDLTAASTLDGTELYYTVQGGANRKVTGAQIKTLAGGFAVATIRPNSAQLKALNTAPLQLVATPGAGFAVMVLGLSMIYRFGSIPYTNVDTPTILLGSTSLSLPTSDTFSVFSGSANAYTQLSPAAFSQAALILAEDLPLYFADDTAWADGDGTAVISVAYVIVPVV